jgi:hypothetical protein
VRVFACPHCRAWVEFEDRECLACRTRIAYHPGLDELVTAAEHPLCRLRDAIGCTWTASPGPGAGGLCDSCRLTTDRPRDDDPAAHSQLVLAEFAKRRLVRQLRHLELPVTERAGDRPDDQRDDPHVHEDGDEHGGEGLAFRLLAPAEGQPVTTGHADGVITIDLSESNDPHREALRIRLGEPYRTMLGHLRHEIGHYYWLVLVDGGGSAVLDGFRELFGDERQDYGAALQTHYGDDPTDDWSEEHISHYATMHPWEDFAETFAHYLHIADVLETTAAVGVTVEGPHGVPEPLAGRIRSTGADRIADLPIDDVLGRWHGTALALNAMSRSMGRQDLYPFVITPGVSRKLGFVHGLVGSPAGAAAS